MGLFSRSKQSPRSDIPAEILAEVTVNGEKKASSVPLEGNAQKGATTEAPHSNSPFLKQDIAPVPKPVTPYQPQVFTSPFPTPAEQPISSPHVSGEIRFTDLPEVKKPEVNPTVTTEIPDFSQITQDQVILARHKEHLSPLKEGVHASSTKEKKTFSSSNVLSLCVFVLILALISGGSWYYLNTRKTIKESNEQSIDALVPIIDTESESKQEGTILVNQPNYLQIDVETVTTEQMKELLDAEFQKIRSENISTAVEYLVVDKNQNPVAFSRFALLVGADNPADLVNASLEPFSLYLYNDAGSLRYALAVQLKREMSGTLPQDKSVYPESLKKLFYPSELSSGSMSTVAFKQSNYFNSAIYYTMVSESLNYSFDMTLQEGTLTLANSKNALRAVIDKRRVPQSAE